MAPQRRSSAVGDGRTTRRDYLLVTTTVGATVLAGCSGGGSEPEFPGGTVVLDNQSDGPERFHVAVAAGAEAPTLEVDLDGGQREVHEGYVSPAEGTTVTLEGWFGIVEEEVETVEFYPSGGGGDGPEVVHMVLTDAVSVDWHWETSAGT